MKQIKNFTINFGPQHPASHGVLRLIISLDGERILDIDPHIGFLHRGTEKLVEYKPYIQNIGYMDRLDYVSMMCNEHSYVLAIEKILKLKVPIRAQYIRVMFDEITRILNHLLWLAAHALDIGAMAPFLYCFREREILLDCYEAVSGARMHATYYRPGGVMRDLPDEMPKYKTNSWVNKTQLDKLNYNRCGSLLDYINDFVLNFPNLINEYENLLTENRIWKNRTVNIGVLSPDKAINFGCSGPILRASGIKWDLRKNRPYEVYSKLKFKVPIRNNGDCYDRYLVRIEEMRQSIIIIKQCIEWLKINNGSIMNRKSKVTPSKRFNMKHDMESLINNFKLYSEGFCIPEGEAYSAIEHPKGEFGIYLVSDGSNKPYRLKIRAASYSHLSLLNELSKGYLLSDLVAILSSIDVVFGEVDR